MKKLLMLSALFFVFSVPAAEARPEGGGHKGKMFERADANGDGVITKDEFMATAEERFSKMDLDGNGEITKDEAREAREKMKAKWKEHKQKKEGQSGGEE